MKKITETERKFELAKRRLAEALVALELEQELRFLRSGKKAGGRAVHAAGENVRRRCAEFDKANRALGRLLLGRLERARAAAGLENDSAAMDEARHLVKGIS